MARMTPYEEGYSAYWEDLCADENPYMMPFICMWVDPMRHRHYEWLKGWYQARFDETGII
jgi:hypothetical protein